MGTTRKLAVVCRERASRDARAPIWPERNEKVHWSDGTPQWTIYEPLAQTGRRKTALCREPQALGLSPRAGGGGGGVTGGVAGLTSAGATGLGGGGTESVAVPAGAVVVAAGAA